MDLFYDKGWNKVNSPDDAKFYREVIFKDNGELVDDGQVTDYFMSGQKQFEGKMKSINPDILHGEATWYYKNGQVKKKGEFKDDQPIGKFVYFYKNGNKKAEGRFAIPDGHTVRSATGEEKESAKDGEWFFYTQSGSLEEVKVYNSGRSTETLSGKKWKLSNQKKVKSFISSSKKEMKDLYIERKNVLGASIKNTKKKPIYKAYERLMSYYSEEINKTDDYKKIKNIKTDVKSLDQEMRDYLDSTTGDLEDKLKDLEKPEEIKKAFKI